MNTDGRQFLVVRNEETLPVPSPAPQRRRGTLPAPTRVAAADRLVGAFDLLSRQGTGQNAWAAPLRHDPIAFLLDTIGDAINLWGPRRKLLYRNRAAMELGLGSGDETALERFSARGVIYERRCLTHRAGGTQYMVEILREIRPAARPEATTETDKWRR
jgi:hypothetical protein